MGSMVFWGHTAHLSFVLVGHSCAVENATGLLRDGFGFATSPIDSRYVGQTWVTPTLDGWTLEMTRRPASPKDYICVIIYIYKYAYIYIYISHTHIYIYTYIIHTCIKIYVMLYIYITYIYISYICYIYIHDYTCIHCFDLQNKVVLCVYSQGVQQSTRRGSLGPFDRSTNALTDSEQNQLGYKEHLLEFNGKCFSPSLWEPKSILFVLWKEHVLYQTVVSGMQPLYQGNEYVKLYIWWWYGLGHHRNPHRGHCRNLSHCRKDPPLVVQRPELLPVLGAQPAQPLSSCCSCYMANAPWPFDRVFPKCLMLPILQSNLGIRFKDIRKQVQAPVAFRCTIWESCAF